MNFGLTQNPSLASHECLILGIFSDVPLSPVAFNLDNEQLDIITRLCQKITETGDSAWQMDLQGHSLLIIQCGKKDEFTSLIMQQCILEITAALIKFKIKSATLCLPQLEKHTPNWQLEQMIIQIDYQLYQLLDFKKKINKPHALESIHFYLPGAQNQIIDLAQAICSGIHLTRHLANMPANICTPTYLGEQGLYLAEQFESMQCKVMGPDEMRAMGMNALLAVSQGSDQPPRLVELQYLGGGDSQPIVLVGKGITFDAGGLCIKPGNVMDEMKFDMCGAASVLGTLKACAQLKLPVNIVGLIACSENLLGGSAVKSGDIVTSMSGQTIEIVNTDAEGRLVLADALTYAERFKPYFVLDIATLTGAMIVALGSVATGFMTKDNELAELLEHAAQDSGDKVWRMPLDAAYQEALNSPLADMINAGFDRTAGSITAACFLSRFTEQFRWAHLDIAGTAWISGKNRNATGRPVPLLTQLIRHVSKTR